MLIKKNLQKMVIWLFSYKKQLASVLGGFPKLWEGGVQRVLQHSLMVTCISKYKE